MVKIEDAQRISRELEAAAAALNRAIGAAASIGMLVEVETVEVRQMSDAGPTPYVNAVAKIRPDQLEV
ncbi:MAG TPA: hypothetical protein DC031_01560 [Sulfitobacter sp.]|uniref:hypothetical protein n=1 Tax=Sulfitobacter dubius TaxID=218673 RepID=UPI000E9EB61D|nr:hypothetical protein [Sulfitobacter sp.]